MIKTKLNKGFTLIELLVVISMIGILSSLALVSFTTSQKQTKDVQRKSEIKQYATSLEGFANQNLGFFPSRSSAAESSASVFLCEDLGLTGCSEDPKAERDESFTYKYNSNGSSDGEATATDYVLWAKLEGSDNYWVACSTGKVGTMPQAGFSVSGGVCPL
ncbi:type II secretion system protein [Patescibacteria group bacterium]